MSEKEKIMEELKKNNKILICPKKINLIDIKTGKIIKNETPPH